MGFPKTILSLRRGLRLRRPNQPPPRSLGLPGPLPLSNPRTLPRSFPMGISTVINATRNATRRVSHAPPDLLSTLTACAPTEVISCTEVVKKCKTKYCKPCLGNRYGEDIDKIKETPPSGRGKSKMPYTFKSVFSAQVHFPRSMISDNSPPDAPDVRGSVTVALAVEHKGSNQPGMTTHTPGSLGAHRYAQQSDKRRSKGRHIRCRAP